MRLVTPTRWLVAPSLGLAAPTRGLLVPSWRWGAPCTRAVCGQLRAQLVLEIQRVVACLDLARTQLLRRAAGAAIVGAEARTPGPAAAVAAVAVVGAEARTPGPAATVAPIIVRATARHPSPSIIRWSAAAIVVAGAAAIAIVTAVTAAAAAAAAAARRRAAAAAVHANRALPAWVGGHFQVPADALGLFQQVFLSK